MIDSERMTPVSRIDDSVIGRAATVCGYGKTHPPLSAFLLID